MFVLGIETSCDDTSVALVHDARQIIGEKTASQATVHNQFGGIVPEIAAREHLLAIDTLLWQLLQEHAISWNEIDRIAVTSAPGLVSSLLVGVSAAKFLSLYHSIELVSVNHLKAHIAANHLAVAEPIQLPFICLLASGGHTQLLLVRSYQDIQLLGQTLDDSAGEAFDKVARLLGLSYPGGPEIQKLSEQYTLLEPESKAIPLLLAALKVQGLNFSFSGIKTAVSRLVQKLQAAGELEHHKKMQIAFSFQELVCQDLHTKILRASQQYNCPRVAIAGGVAANRRLRQLLDQSVEKELLQEISYPPLAYCTDNAAMVAAAGYLCPETIGQLDFGVASRVHISGGV